MTDSRLPVDIRGFIQACIPHVDAAELLLALALDEGRAVSARKLAARLEHSELTDSTLRSYLARFKECGLVEHHGELYSLARSTPECEAILLELRRLYNEQPVALVRMIYAPKDGRLRAFADAFRLKR